MLRTYVAASGMWTTSGGTIRAKDVPEALRIVDALHEPIREDYVERWTPIDLGDAIEKMLKPGHMGRAGANGKLAYLAYAVLGALLEVPPEKIRNTLDNFRHKRRPKPTR
jgi:hypothetical protein